MSDRLSDKNVDSTDSEVIDETGVDQHIFINQMHGVKHSHGKLNCPEDNDKYER